MLFSVRNGLKEDALVDLPNSLTMSQAILIMSLFTLLLGWFVTFAYLALRPMPEQHLEQYVEPMELPVTPLPIKSPVMQTLTVSPQASGMRTTAQKTPIVTVSADSTCEMILDHSRRSYHQK